MVESRDPVQFCYKFHRILSSIVGLWPYQAPRESRLKVSILVVLIISRMLWQVAALVETRNHFEKAVECMPHLAAVGLRLMKLIILSSNRDKARDLLTRMRKDWENVIDASEIEIMERDAKQSLKLSKIYATHCYTAASTFFLEIVITSLSAATVDSITNITKSYQKLPAATESMCQFFQVCVCCLIMSLGGLHAVTKINELGVPMRYSLLISHRMFELLFYSWPSQALMDRSLSISEVVYSMEWYRVSIRSRKLLLRMMTRSVDSCKMTAGKLYVMSMENYSKILSSAFSHFTMLSTIRKQYTVRADS